MFSAGLLGLLLVSLTVNILLAFRIAQLRGFIETNLAEHVLKVGDTVPPIVGTDLDGNAVAISYAASTQDTVIYYFSPACIWCAKNLNNLKSLADHATRYRFIGISPQSDQLISYVRGNRLTFPIVTNLPPSVVSSYKFSGTPSTLVISARGKVLKRWPGAYEGQNKDEIEKYFNFTLPGLDLKAKPLKASQPS